MERILGAFWPDQFTLLPPRSNIPAPSESAETGSDLQVWGDDAFNESLIQILSAILGA